MDEISDEDVDFVINDLQQAISRIAGTIQMLKRRKIINMAKKWDFKNRLPPIE
jgi:hypothetical protein